MENVKQYLLLAEYLKKEHDNQSTIELSTPYRILYDICVSKINEIMKREIEVKHGK